MSNRGFWVSPNEYREFAGQTAPSLRGEIATREAATWTTPWRSLPNPDEVLRKMGRARVDVYRQLLPDARVWAGVQQRKTGIKSMDWEIQPEQAEARHVAFIEDVFKALPIPRITGEFLNAPLYGHQPMERRWYTDGTYYLVSDLLAKPQEWFQWDVDGNLRFLDRRHLPDGIVPEPYQFQVAQHEAEYRNPYGFAILSCCFWPVVFKRGGKKFWAVFTEKWGMPHAFAHVPPNTDKKKVDEYLDQLSSLVQDGVGVIYDNAKVTVVEAAGKTASGDLYRGLIQDSNEEIATAILGHQGSLASTPGKLGQEQMAYKAREDIVWADKNLVADQYNLLIKDLIRVNFGETAKAPVFAFYEKEEVDSTLADRDAKLADKLKVRFTPVYFQEKHGLKPEYFTLAPETQPALPPEPAALPTPPETKPPVPPTELAQGEEPDLTVKENQATLKALQEAVGADVLQGMAEEALAPLFSAVKDAKGYDTLKAELAGLFSQMETQAFEAALGKMLFLSEALGRES